MIYIASKLATSQENADLHQIKNSFWFNTNLQEFMSLMGLLFSKGKKMFSCNKPFFSVVE